MGFFFRDLPEKGLRRQVFFLNVKFYGLNGTFYPIRVDVMFFQTREGFILLQGAFGAIFRELKRTFGGFIKVLIEVFRFFDEFIVEEFEICELEVTFGAS